MGLDAVSYALWVAFLVIMGTLAVAIWRSDGKLWACSFVVCILALMLA